MPHDKGRHRMMVTPAGCTLILRVFDLTPSASAAVFATP